MQKKINLVELEKIFPSPTNPRKYFNEARLKDLAESIKKVGVIQAITLREKPDDTDNYEIVCGERRYLASKLAGTKTIPADIRVLTDDEVQELQFIENIEREDVHPMDEAVTFKAMQENKKRPWLLEDISAKINKPVTYIVQRLSLNELIPDLQKEFWDGKFLIGHAILFSRLTDEDQKHCLKSVKKGGEYSTVKETRDYIERNIICQLSSAPFKMDDNTLDVKCGAGACTNCFKRSGANTLLFSDIKQADRCFDKTCFNEKKKAWLIREVADVLENKPEIFLADYGYMGAKVPAEITKLSKQYKIRILNYGKNEVSSYSQKGFTPIKILLVSGDDAGTYKTYYKKASAKAAVAAKVAAGKKLTVRDIDDEIEAIQNRVKRGDKLDFEKVQEAIVKELKENYPQEVPLKYIFDNAPDEQQLRLSTLFVNFILFFLVDNYQHEDLLKVLGIENEEENINEDPIALFDKLMSINSLAFATIIKTIIIDRFHGFRTNVPAAFIIRKLAQALDIEVDKHVALQDIAKKKRIANANSKIAELESQKSDLMAKKKVAPVAKKIAPKAKRAA